MGSNYPRGDPPPGRQRQVPPRGDPPPGRQRVPPRLLINPFHDIRQRLSTGQAFKPIGQVSVSRMLPGPPLFGRLASQLFEVDPSLAFSTAGDSAEEGGESTLPPPQVPRVPRDFCETTLISFLGRRYKIILQSKNGPYSLIAICNYLILTRKLTLPPSMTIVYLDYLVDRVFSQVFSKMKDESYKTAQAAVEQTATGLDIDIYCTSVDGFEDTPQYGLFRILDIPLYHAWVLDMNNQEDTILLNAVDGRSYNQLNIDRAKYNSKKDADFMIDAAETRRCNDLTFFTCQLFTDANMFLSLIANALFLNCLFVDELIHTFLKDNPGQVTEFGLHTLKAATPDRKLFIFFQNEHFNVVYKYHGRFFVLESDVGFRNYQNIWRSVDSPGESGVLVHDITISRDQHSVLKSGNYFEGAKQSFKKKPHSARQTQHHSVSSSLESSQGPPPVRHSHMAGEHGSSSSVKPRPSPTNAQLETRPPSPGTVRADFASYFTSGKDQKLEHMFLDFLRSFERNNIPYYGAIVDAMKTLSSPEMHIHFDHIWSYAPELAHDLCQCYPRIQKNLENAVRTFIRDLNLPGFHCENPVVRICDMPKPDRWIPLRTFLKLRGYHLTKPRHIRCDGFFLPVIDTTQIGRIILTNLLTRITRSHKGGRSWNGNWTLDHVMVSDSLDVKINLPCNYQAARKTEAHDFLRVATDVLPEYEVGGKLPGLFRHLDESLRMYIDHLKYGSAMLRKFQRFITIHPALKSSLTRLQIIDNIYSAHQATTGQKTGDSNVKSRMVVYPLSPQFILLYMNTTELTWKKVNPMNKEMRMQKKKVMNLEAMLGMMVEMKNALYNLNVESINPLRTQWKEAWFTYAMFVIMDNMGKQQFLRLSDLELVNSNSLDEILPAMVKCLIFHKDGYHHIYDKDIYDRVLGWIDEILENYELLEFPKSYGIDFPAITPTGHDDAFPDPHRSAPPSGHYNPIGPPDVPGLEPSCSARRPKQEAPLQRPPS
uniref:MINDY deubiquitinase domain-containing protein n=1 Tax=Oryza glumipatula TaxID=40148 RepID=A0A0E0AEG8_9ORYZ